MINFGSQFKDMQKYMTLSSMILALILLLASSFGKAQNNVTLKIDGVVEYRGNPLSKAKVTITKDGVVINEIKTEDRGKFRMELDRNANFTIKASRDGYLDRFLLFSTYLPESVSGKEVFKFAIDMFKEDKSGIPESAYEVPLVKFDENAKEFVYTENM
ncbi:MAG TPA: hypothetical protein DDX92_02375 [Flavobacteriales bacterium]|jgi:hypothetical protein|nr:hypothetical protein [Flavobacteriales bacterium]